jgi:UTP:GlnB (protein PII) uridylyltransferase
MPIDAGAGLRAELLALLREGSAASWASFERVGLLDRHLPELARLRAEARGRQGGRPWERLAAFAGHLRSGADQAAAAAWRALPDPDGLLLACLVRAVGDRAGTGRVRHVAGRTAERLGLGPDASQAVARLAAEEVDLAELAVDVDPHDEEQVLRLAARLAAAPRRYLLAQPADAVARHLVMAEPAPGRRELRLAVTPEEPGAWRIDVVTRDRPGLLASLAGALCAAGVDVTRAQASTWPDDLVVDVFHVAGPSLQAEPGFAGRVGRMLHGAVAGDPQPGRLLADRAAQAQAGSGPVVVRVDADAAPWHSSVRVEAPDRLGLLYEILLELARHHVDVQVARVGSEAGRAVDLFLVTDAGGWPLERAAADRLGTALADRLAGRPALR